MPVLLGLSFLASRGHCHAIYDFPSTATKAYVFTYFRSGGGGLHLAWSVDGLRWKALNNNKRVMRSTIPNSSLRDPSLIQGPDGKFHLVWGPGVPRKSLAVAHSENLIDWSPAEEVGVLDHEPESRNCWAPEIFYDPAKQHYLIFWSTTIPGRFPDTDHTGDDGYNHRIYYVTTKDFQKYSETRLLHDPGFNVIDATIVQRDGRYLMFMKDETLSPVKKVIRIAEASHAEGPYGPAGEPISPDWVEGPSVLRVGEEWIVYYDEYFRHRYGAIKSRDLKTWEVITPQLSMPEGARHGSALEVSTATLHGLLKAQAE